MIRIGIDLGGTNIVAAAIDDNYQILSKVSCKTAMPRPAEEILDDMAQLAISAAEKAGVALKDVLQVGIGCPGTCNLETGIVEYSNNLDFYQLPLIDKMKARLGVPVRMQNDANAAALGEFLAGAAKGSKSCVCITLGTGVGSGIILDGKIYSGFNFAGAEIGHSIIIADGEPCTCGMRGCWEAYASCSALVRQTKAAMQQHPESALWKVEPSLDKVNGKTSFDAMRLGDPVGTQVVEQYIRYVAYGLINTINIFQPEVICIGGGLSKEGDNLIVPLNNYIEKNRYSKYCQNQTKLTTAKLGNDAGLIGAAFIDAV